MTITAVLQDETPVEAFLDEDGVVRFNVDGKEDAFLREQYDAWVLDNVTYDPHPLGAAHQFLASFATSVGDLPADDSEYDNDTIY